MKKSLFRAKFVLIKSKENNSKIKQNNVGLKSACHIVICGCDKIRQRNNIKEPSRKIKNVPERIADRLDALETKIEEILDRIK